MRPLPVLVLTMFAMSAMSAAETGGDYVLVNPRIDF